MKKIFIINLFCLMLCALSAQNSINEINIGTGQTLFKNSGIAPSGINDVHYTLDYQYQNKLKSNSNILFRYFVGLDFSNFDKQASFHTQYLKYNNGLDMAILWLALLPVKNEKMSLYIGGGLLFDADIYYFYNKGNFATVYSFGYGQWFLSPAFCLSGDYNLKKIQLQSQISIPVLSFGYQSKSLFYATAYENIKMALTPNAFGFFTRRFYPRASLAVSYPFCSTAKTEWRIQLKYAFEGLTYSGFPNEKKITNTLLLGIAWALK